MAHMQIIRIKAMVDKEKNMVVFVESDQDFVNVLLSFLTLPIGTITRLIGNVNTKSSSAPATGCMKNLYKSVEDLDVKHFSSKDCKNMLLFPRRAAEAKCNRLKLRIDPLEPTKYCYCANSTSYCCGKVFIAAPGAFVCSECFNGLSVIYMKEFHTAGRDIFVKGRNARYIVTDDLQVKLGSVGDCLSMLGAYGIHDWSRLEERNVDVSPKEVLSLLQRSLISKTPLTDMILLKEGGLSAKVKIEPSVSFTSFTSAKVCVTLMISKSTNKSLYAVVNDDFVDLLFSFLTLPLGSIVKLCGGTCSMGCVDNLYKSVEGLSSQGQIVSEDCKAFLVNPKLATHFRSMNQLPRVDEVDNKYRVNFNSVDGSTFLTNVTGVASSYCDIKRMVNPKLPVHPETKSGGQFVASPATYMVTNDLVVTPLCLTTGLIFLKSKNVPISDVEERIVTVGKQEAFNLLMASMLSDTAALDAIIDSTNEVDYWMIGRCLGDNIVGMLSTIVMSLLLTFSKRKKC